MTGLRTSLLAAALAWALLGSRASAQQPANLTVVSGNGQLVCGICSGTSWSVFEPMVVRVTDSNGNPVPNTPVNWSILAGGNPNTTTLNSAQTTTGSDGTTSNRLNTIFANSRAVYTVAASLPNLSVSLTFTLTASARGDSVQYVQPQVTSGRGTITGQAGGTGSPSIQVQVKDLTGAGVANVSVRLIPADNYVPGASVSCATGSGADPGSVLTDQNGSATCTPILGPVPGTGSYNILVGGVTNAQINGTGALGYALFLGETIQVSAGVPGSMKLISGTPQSASAGQALASPLVAEVDSAAGNPVSGSAVNWTVSPAGAATLANSTSTSDSNGRVSNTVTLASTAGGTVQITASAGTLSVTFTITVNVPVTGLTIVSGYQQTTSVGAVFPQPLVVQLSASGGQVAANVPVQFAITTGSATLSAATVNTDSSGRASVMVTAGNTAGSVSVTASAQGFSRSFALTVVAGPSITPSSFVNGAGFYTTDSLHSALTPCGVGTIIAPGIAPAVQGVVAAPMFGPLPYQLAQVGISFNNSQAPLYNVANTNGQQQATFQVPCDVTPSDTVPVTVTVGGQSSTVNVVVRSAGPGIFQYTDTAGLQQAVLVRHDGTYVNSTTNRAHAGETLRLYVTGIGRVQPPVPTNAVPVPGTDSVGMNTVVVALNGATAITPATVRRAPGLIGVDEITFQLPANAPSGYGVLYVAVYPADAPGTLDVSNTAWIPIQ